MQAKKMDMNAFAAIDMPERIVNLNLERQSSTATFAISTPLVDAMTLTVNTVEVHTNPMMA